MTEPPLEPSQSTQTWWMRILLRVQRSWSFPLAVGLLSVVSACTGLYPFGPVLVAAIAIAPRRWREIYLASCIGAMLGVLVLAGTVEIYGLRVVESMFPGIEQSDEWLSYTHWISRYGWLALVAFTALPIPQMPILLLAALSHLSLVKIALAVLLGKLIKYGIYGIATLAALKGIQARK